MNCVIIIVSFGIIVLCSMYFVIVVNTSCIPTLLLPSFIDTLWVPTLLLSSIVLFCYHYCCYYRNFALVILLLLLTVSPVEDDVPSFDPLTALLFVIVMCLLTCRLANYAPAHRWFW